MLPNIGVDTVNTKVATIPLLSVTALGGGHRAVVRVCCYRYEYGCDYHQGGVSVSSWIGDITGYCTLYVVMLQLLTNHCLAEVYRHRKLPTTTSLG